MLNAKVNDLKMFETLLTVIGRFTQQCQFIIGKKNTSIYCKNPSVYTTARLLLDTDTILLDESAECQEVKLCIRDIFAFRSSVAIVNDLRYGEDISAITLKLEEKEVDGEVYIKSLRYDGSNGGSFKLVSIDREVINDFISSDLKSKLNPDWSFNINVKNLDVMQNKTNNIISHDDVGVYIKEDAGNRRAIMSFESKKSAAANSIALPIGFDCKGTISDIIIRDNIMIHETSMKIMNIMKIQDSNDIKCSFDKKFNVFLVDSRIDSSRCFIRSRLLIQLIAGGK